MKEYLLKLWWCILWKDHKWTSAYHKGIKPTDKQRKSACGFWEYAKMYCDRCGHVSELSKKNLCENLD